MKALQRARRSILVFGGIYLLSLIAFKTGAPRDLAIWLCASAIVGVVLSGFFAIIFQVIWEFQKKAGHG